MVNWSSNVIEKLNETLARDGFEPINSLGDVKMQLIMNGHEYSIPIDFLWLIISAAARDDGDLPCFEFAKHIKTLEDKVKIFEDKKLEEKHVKEHY